jgi:hypothetical protein
MRFRDRPQASPLSACALARLLRLPLLFKREDFAATDMIPAP